MSFREQSEESSLFSASAEESLDGENVFKSYRSTEGLDGGREGARRRRNLCRRLLSWLHWLRIRALVLFLESLRWSRDQFMKSFCNKKITHSESYVERNVHFNSSENNLGFPSNFISTGKYTVWNFIFKFIWEQFRKLFNLYFLLIIILQQIPNVSPTGRWTTIVPLSIVLGLAAIKEVIEDLRRHIADRKINRRKIKVWRDGQCQTVLWQNVLAGDIVRVNDREDFPADLVLLSSSEKDGNCYIQTANLDGEINLKLRRSHTLTKSKSVEELSKLKGHITCEGPNSLLYEFSGTLNLEGMRVLPVLPENILLRGAQLRNTDFVYGIAVYTGHESKLLMNTHSTPLKRSTMDRTIDKLVIILFAVLIVLSVSSAIGDTVWSCLSINPATNENRFFYLPTNTGCHSGAVLGYFFLSIAQFIILYNNLVPISLVVTVEIVKFIQAIWINQDMEMYDPVADVAARARTSNLNEELGQVRYVFSDKTGTLTCNKMEFKKCSIQGMVYNQQDESGRFDEMQLVSKLKQGLESGASFLNSAERRFLEIMSVCHSVIPETTEEGTTYRSSSPDEEALVKAAKRCGFNFVERSGNSVTVNVFGKSRKYEVLNLLEFTSERKRMSVIVRTPEGRLKLYIKGADSVILERLVKNDPHRAASDGFLKTFSEEGLRTLCLAEVDLDDTDYKQWSQLYHEASLIINAKEKKKQQDKLADNIERKLLLVGVAAIEDKLQDGVPEAIETLRRANISVWMLTGDKLETAINISYACKLLTPDMNICRCTEEELTSQSETSPFVSAVEARLRDLLDNYMNADSALIIDGKALDTALQDDEKQKLFFQVAKKCKSVICCRMTPGQKAEVVKVTKKNDKKATTLAIGDGANDVSMIQSADVGVGISGAEGLQATLASDFSITQFRFLVRLLLIHGIWNYKRLALVILYSFYKNIFLYIMEFWFAPFNMFSGQIIFERWTIGLYNVFFTFLPPVALGIADQDVEPEMTLSTPERYRKTQKGHFFNMKVFGVWFVIALGHSLVLFVVVEAGLFEDIVRSTGYTGGLWFHGNLLYTATLCVVLVKLLLIAHSWNVLLVSSVILSFILWILFLPVYASLWPGLPIGSEMTGVPDQLFASGYLSAYMVFSPLAILFFDIMYTLYCSLSFSKWYRDSRMMPTKFFPEPTSLPCAKCSRYSRLPRDVKMVLRGLSRCFPFIHGFYGSCKCTDSVPKVGTPQPSQPGYDEISNGRKMKAVKTENSQKEPIFGTGAATMSSVNANDEDEDLI